MISLAVVGGAMAVGRGFAIGSAAQPATADVKTTYAGPLLAASADQVGGSTGADPAPDARGPVEGEVPQAPPARPAEPVSVVPARATRRAPAPRPASPTALPPLTAGRRLRSALGVLLLVVAVGLVLAAALGVLVVAVSRALHGAVS